MAKNKKEITCVVCGKIFMHRGNGRPPSRCSGCRNTAKAKPVAERKPILNETPVDENKLTDKEKRTLKQCEDVIRRNKKSFIETVTALMTIRDQRLYRENYKTFEEYCRTELGIGRNWVNKQIRAVRAFNRLKEMGKEPTTDLYVLLEMARLEKRSDEDVKNAYSIVDNGNIHEILKLRGTVDGLMGRKRQAPKVIGGDLVEHLAAVLSEIAPKVEQGTVSDMDVQRLLQVIKPCLQKLGISLPQTAEPAATLEPRAT